MVLELPNGVIVLSSKDLEILGEVGATRYLESEERQNGQLESEYVGWLTPELTVLIIEYLRPDLGREPTLAPELQVECDRPQTLPLRDSRQTRRRSGRAPHRSCQLHREKPEPSANHRTNRSTNDSLCRCTN